MVYNWTIVDIKIVLYQSLTNGYSVYYDDAPFNHMVSVTRLGDLLDFGQLFKAFGNN